MRLFWRAIKTEGRREAWGKGVSVSRVTDKVGKSQGLTFNYVLQTNFTLLLYIYFLILPYICFLCI